MKSYIFAASVLCGLAIYAKDDLSKWLYAEPLVTTQSAKPSPAALDSRFGIGQVGSAPICTTDTECVEECPDECCMLPPDHPDYCDGGPDPEESPWPSKSMP